MVDFLDIVRIDERTLNLFILGGDNEEIEFEYEQKSEPIPNIYGVQLLKVLITERQLQQKDLVSIFKTESIVSDILNGKRQLTVRHIQELAHFFNLSPAVFFPQQNSNLAITVSN